jgi:hypothetical protein
VVTAEFPSRSMPLTRARARIDRRGENELGRRTLTAARLPDAIRKEPRPRDFLPLERLTLPWHGPLASVFGQAIVTSAGPDARSNPRRASRICGGMRSAESSAVRFAATRRR